MAMTNDHIVKQSWAAYSQWRDDWIKNTKLNKYHIKQSLYNTLGNIGRNKTLVVVAYGPSLEKQFDLLKERRSEFHIICVDKAFKSLVNRGIYPDYVTLCDANVSFEKYCEGVDTSKSILISNIAAESNWVSYWKGPKFFFINQDSIKSEDLFVEISGYGEMVPAASNVSNAQIMICFFVLKYRFNLMIGYDYSWEIGHYYGDEQSDKECWMASHIASDNYGRVVRTSSNLAFSSGWVGEFFKNANTHNYVNCSGEGIMPHAQVGDLKKCLDKIKLL